MGGMLERPVESTVVERYTAKGFRVAVAEMNGWRNNMEDAHLIHTRDDWGFFGVFDGHGGEACSRYVADKLREALEKDGCPADDAASKELLFSTDASFLEWVKEDQSRDSGSTATMCIVHKPSQPSDKYRLRILNAGDSRILLGRRDGSIVDGGGTDQGLTTDHKPDNPDEKERIYRCGGTVEHQEGGCARVNGDLAVCRGFGDGQYKLTGGPGPEERPVTIDPELKSFECDQADFIILVCDGVSEGNFSNPQVVKLVASVLEESGDIGKACKLVCHKAVETNSKDNISCMVVLLDGADETKKEVEFEPGSIESLQASSYRSAYEKMAEKAGLSLEDAVEMRYNMLNVSEAELEAMQQSYLGYHKQLREELSKFGTPDGEPGSQARKEYFKRFVEHEPSSSGADRDVDPLLSLLMGAKGGGKGTPLGGYSAGI
jgi:serine/threonine protein phosphatase PrpC